MTTPYHALWATVIRQALNDATFGLSDAKQRAKLKKTHYDRYSHVDEALSFIEGRTSALRDICNALDWDYDYTRAKLMRVHQDCLPYMPDDYLNRKRPR